MSCLDRVIASKYHGTAWSVRVRYSYAYIDALQKIALITCAQHNLYMQYILNGGIFDFDNCIVNFKNANNITSEQEIQQLKM